MEKRVLNCIRGIYCIMNEKERKHQWLRKMKHTKERLFDGDAFDKATIMFFGP